MRRAKDKTSRKKQRPETPPAATTKKAFDLPRDSVYAADPITELCICGAKGVVPNDESGDLDTPPGPDLPVKDLRRLRKPLNPLFKENVDKRKSHTPIVIAKIGDVATVIEGKRRVRAARASNRKRMKDGRPLMKIRCVMQRDATPLAIMATVISGNNAREDDILADKIEKLRAFLEMGATEADAAVEFNVGPDRIRDWLDYDDRATDRVKAAVDDGQIPASTGLELSKIKDVDKQNQALDKLIAGTGVRDRSARAARALAQGANDRTTATDRKSQRLLLAYLQKPDPDRHRSSTADQAFWRGVVDALKVVTGQEADDPRVAAALAEARSSAPTPATKGIPTPRSAKPVEAEAEVAAE